MKKLNKKINVALANARFALQDRSGASLWEYLLLIAIVAVIGGVLLSAITKDNGGIESLWDTLFDRFNDTLNSTNVNLN